MTDGKIEVEEPTDVGSIVWRTAGLVIGALCIVLLIGLLMWGCIAVWNQVF